ncbi:MAG TPA: TetR/AcrR family transcriptional regulator [Mycobacterium sp.]|jgi:AcrR family transcriptional regulator
MRSDTEWRGQSGAILDAFARSVARKGYDGTSFTIIASELGISRGLIAHHFGTKERLLATLHVSYMKRRVSEGLRIVAALPTPAEQLAGLLFASILYQVHDRDATVVFQREVARFAREADDSEGRKLRNEYAGILRDVINAGIASGEFRNIDAKIRSLLVFGSAHWAWTWFRPDGELTAEQIGAELVDLVVGSLLVTRRRLARIADPEGEIVATVQAILTGEHLADRKANMATA